MDIKTKKIKHSASLMTVLKHLLVYADLTANGLAKMLHLPTPTIYRLVTGDVRDPRISTLCSIADYFGVTIEQLLGRKLLDSQFYDGAMQSARPDFTIPLLTMSEAFLFEKKCKTSSAWFRWQSNTEDACDTCFSIAIKNNLYEPVFSHGTVIIVDPTIKPENGDYVVVNFEGDSTSVLKRYISEGKNKFLSTVTLDAKTTQFNTKESTIVGVVIEACRHFKN